VRETGACARVAQQEKYTAKGETVGFLVEIWGSLGNPVKED